MNQDPNSREFKQALDRYLTREPDYEDGIKCPSCNAMAGYPDEDHSTSMVTILVCDNCGYSRQEVNNIPDKEDKNSNQK
jgi:C4-type Zn-finger protein